MTGDGLNAAIPEIRSGSLAPLIVVSGPSGVGKTTVVERLITESSLPLRRAVTATTRTEREGEKDGRDYHFWTTERFQQEVAAGRMLESALVFGRDFYGTPRSEVDPYRGAGPGVILVIDVQGAARVRETGLEHLSVFIEPPSFDVLESRLRGRNDMTDDRITRRLEEARRELARAGEFDCRIVNLTLSAAVSELERVIRARFTL
jgi:guanylate kinase